MAGLLAVTLETVAFWWTTGATPAPAVVGGHVGLVTVGSLVLGALAAGTSERVAARLWLLGLPWLPISPILSRLVGAWAVWCVAGVVLLLALGRATRQRESVLVGAVAGSLLAARLGFFAIREYDGSNTGWGPLLTLLLLALSALGGYVFWPRRFSRPVMSTAGRGIVLLTLSLGVTGSVVAVGQRGIGGERLIIDSDRVQPPVALIVLDTVRADHLSLYGYPHETMPHLTAFAREEAVVVERAITNAPDSLAAHASLFTGLYPINHGAHRPSLADPSPPSFGYGLDPRATTVAEILSDAGYLTLGVSGNFGPVSRELGLGLDRGFDVYRSRPDTACQFARQSAWRPLARWVNRIDAVTWLSDCRVRYRRADAITDEAMALVDRAGGSSFFLFVNYMDAHDPYEPPEVFLPQRPGDDPSNPVTRYDGELSFLDTHLDRLTEHLRGHPAWDDMLVIITSDHGEAFGEHGLVGHTSSLYDVMIRVPLILKLPDHTGIAGLPRAGTRWPRPMQLVDVAPLVLAHVGLGAPTPMDGRSLGDESSVLRAWSFPSMVLRDTDERYRRELRSIEDGRWKLIEDDRGRVELYDLRSDPGELDNRAAHEPERVETLRTQLGPRESGASGIPAELSEESLERLRSLGYVR